MKKTSQGMVQRTGGRGTGNDMPDGANGNGNYLDGEDALTSVCGRWQMHMARHRREASNDTEMWGDAA